MRHYSTLHQSTAPSSGGGALYSKYMTLECCAPSELDCTVFLFGLAECSQQSGDSYVSRHLKQEDTRLSFS